MDEQKDPFFSSVKPGSTNIWGWKWSFVSLVIIAAGFIFLLTVGPKDGWNAEESDTPVEDTTAIIND